MLHRQGRRGSGIRRAVVTAALLAVALPATANAATPPTAHEVTNAAHWKLSGFAELAVQQSAASTVTQQSIEGALAAGNPVVIGLPVYNNFFSVTSTNHGYYGSASGPLAGYHAVTA